MKILSSIILLFFLLTQIAPTIVCMFDLNEETTYNFIDDDQKSKEEKELKSDFIAVATNFHLFTHQELSKTVSNNYLINEYKIYTSHEIIPPRI